MQPNTANDIMVKCIDLESFNIYIENAYQHYVKIAPPVADYLDIICGELSDMWYKITAYEIVQICAMWYDGLWMEPDTAINHVLKVMDRVGRDTSHIMEG